MRSLRGLGIGIAIVLVSGLLVAPPVAAQSGKDISRSLCRLYSKAQVRAALQVRMAARPDPSYHDCTWSTVDIGDPERYLNIGWLGISFEDLQAVQPDWTPLTVAGRPALYDPVRPALNLSLDQGVLVLSVNALQAGDWQAGLTKLGELAVANASELVAPPPPDASLLALFPATVGGTALLMAPLYVDREFSAQSGDRLKALKSALKATGRKMADVSLASGQVPDTGAYVAALKVAGADAAKLAEAAIAWSVGSGWTAEPAEFVNGSVNAVTFANDTYTRYFYPKDDVVWVVDAAEPALSEILAALPGSPSLAAVAAPSASASVAPSAQALTDASGGVAGLIPTSVEGEALTVQTMQGSSGGGFSDPKSRTYKALAKGLKSQAKSVDDITIAAAGNASGETGIIGIEVDGADATAFVDLAVETVLSGLSSRKHTKAPGEVGGKAVTVLRPRQAAGRVFYIYPRDDIVWIVGGPDAAVEEIFAALP